MTEETSKSVRIEEETSIKTPDKNASSRPPKRRMGIWNSRKLVMTLIALGVNWSAYWAEIKYLYSFIQPEHITAFVGITRDFHWTTTAILMAYLGVQGAVDWKHGTTTAVTQAVSFVKEKIDRTEDITSTETINQYIKEEGVNAPAIKPFSQLATGDDEKGEFDDFEKET